ncbi:MAG: BadF/BadG/BcrA/BcrD ATPase family protein, partial [Planctomycetota bacterium]|nr:BadF/BadG/BcrA/BcrD ATPase family protein [Planctomycetota bacterium]
MSVRPLVVCGVDGGGTSTRVLIATLGGEVIGEGRSGSGNLHDVGEAVLARHIEEAWRGAWAEAGAGAPGPAPGGFCRAGRGAPPQTPA